MYKCKHFAIEELVGPETAVITAEWKLWLKFDDRLLRLADALRERFGSTTINDWSWGGGFSESGLRTEGMFYYNANSQHAFGRALDMKFKHHTAQHVRDWLRENYTEYYRHIATSITCEGGVSWLHLDVRNGNPGYNEFGV